MGKSKKINKESTARDRKPPWKRTKRSGVVTEEDTADELFQNIITINVGPDATPFYLYAGLVSQDASFFKAALNGSFRESTEQKVSLPDDDVQIFKIYQIWLNLKELRCNFDDGEDWWLHLAKLWIFADKIGSPKFKNEIIDAFFEVYDGVDDKDLLFADPDVVHFVYDNTTQESPLRKLFIHFSLHFDYNGGMVAYPHEFIAGMLEWVMHDGNSWRRVSDAYASVVDKKRSEVYHEDGEQV
ncbi:MAG: hypothetical protein Q9218_003094 [Villophora microphyllina]